MGRRSRKKKKIPEKTPLPRGKPRARWFVVGLLAFLSGAVWIWSYRHEAPPQRILLISIDTLRADYLGCYGSQTAHTPNIDRLASESVLFENAITATPLTLPAHSSILTGRSPLQHGVIDNFGYQVGDREITLAEVLREQGFATGGFVGSFVLDSRRGIAQGFETYFDDFDTSGDSATVREANERKGDAVLDEALQWIRSQGDDPFFAFIHFFDPHTPYDPPEPYREQYGPERLGLYRGEIAFVDHLVGRLVERLKDLGLYDETVIVVLGDHGESLGEHGEQTHGFFIYDATVRVPLIIKAPGSQRGQRSSNLVRTIDVMPTLLDLVGVEIPQTVEGVSVAAHLRDPDSDVDSDRVAYIESHYARLHFGWAPLRGIRTEQYKYIEAPRRELYELTADRSETRDVSREQPGIVAELGSVVEKLRREPPREKEALTPDPETAARLRALGYITASAGSSAPSTGDEWADPKDKIDVFNRVESAMMATVLGEEDRAARLLSSVLHDDPGVMLAYELLGNIYLEQQRLEDAEALWQKAIALGNDEADSLFGLAMAHQGLGKLEAAALGFARALALDPDHTRARYHLARLRLEEGGFEEAERLMRDALREQSDSSFELVLAEALMARGKSEEALPLLRRLEEDRSDDVRVHLSLGNLLLERGDLAGAMKSLRRAESINPNEAAIFNALGSVFARQGDQKQALQAFQEAVRLDPAFAPAQNNVGLALARQGAERPALQAFQKAVALDPSFAPAHSNLGFALAREGRFSEAERAFKAALEKDPSHVDAYNLLGSLYLQSGRAEEAVPLFRRALDLNPEHQEARARLDQALQMLGR